MPERAHHFRIPQASVFALALMGCGAPPEPAANAPIAPPPATADVAANDTAAAGSACLSSFNSEMGEQNLAPAFGDDGYQVWATPGSLTCSPAATGASVRGPVVCNVSGPAEIRYATQEVTYFHIAAGQSATLRTGVADGAVSVATCVVNEAQP